ncbi:MAG: glycosyltransferase family 39 protein [Candidatus Sungiibacteriota bacterium]
MTKKELTLILAILAIGVFLRFYLITQIPPGLYPDEATNGNNAVEALRTGGFKVFYPENNGREGLFINIQAFSLWLFGEQAWALRVVSALFGSLTILGIFLLARELFSDKPRRAMLVSLFSSFFLATSFWHINFSRVGFRAITVSFFSAFGMYFLLRGLRKGKILDTVLAGIFIGLGFHTYIAFRFMPFVILAPFAIYLWRWWKSSRDNLQPSHCVPCVVALFLFITIVVALPVGFYFLQNPQDFLGRSGQVSIFSAANPLYEFVKSNALTLQMFFWRGDCNPRHNFACQPQLFWPVAVFFAVATALALRALFKKTDALPAATLLAWFVFMLFPATLTREGIPHALRSIGLIPPVFLLAGWGAEFLWTSARDWLDRAKQEQKWQSYWPQFHRIKKEVAVLFALLLLFTAFNAYRTYFVRFPENPNTYYAFGTDLANIGQYMNTLPGDARKIVIVNLSGDLIRGIKAPAQTPMFITGTFSEEERREKKTEYLNELGGLTLGAEEKVAIIPLNPADKQLVKEIKKRFPQLKPKAPGDFISFEN